MSALCSEIKKELASKGYAHFTNIEIDDFERTLTLLGDIIHTTDVRINDRSKSLLASTKGLDLHTDHHKADVVAWYCAERAAKGGESMLLDTKDIFAKFSASEKRVLSSIMLHEHKIFDDDQAHHPLITETDNTIKCYYSFWLVKKNISGLEKSLLERFQTLIRKAKHHIIPLKKGDILLVDNGRVLHGRMPIEAGEERLLKRYWVSRSALATAR